MKTEKKMKHLKELHGSDYKIAENEPNIDDWKITDASGQKIGEEKDLLFDKEALKVRYLIADLKKGDILPENKKVMIPIGKASLNSDDKRIEIPIVTREQLSALPDYKKADEITAADEKNIRNVFSGAGTNSDKIEEYDMVTFYNHEDFDEDKFYNRGKPKQDEKIEVVEENIEVGKKEVDRGGKRITSRLVERPVEERVQLRDEEINVKHKQVDRPADSSDFEEKTLEAKETDEVPVVNKEAKVVEEVSLEKDVKTKEEVIEDTVRHTEVDEKDLPKEGISRKRKAKERQKENQ